MGKRVREHFRGNVVGYVALFFAMSLGTAWAIEKNEVKSKHIGPGQVKESDLGTGAVSLGKLAPNSVDGSKVIDDSLKGADVDESSLNLPDPPTIPSSLPPSGAAGGDLTGEYPNPQVSESGLSVGGDLSGALSNAQIAGGAVGTTEVADDSITGADIFNNSGNGTIGSVDIVNNAVGRNDVSTNFIRPTVSLADGSAGWTPDGADTEFVITDAAISNAGAVVVLSLDDNGGATVDNAICAVTNISINGNFKVNCTNGPADGMDLNYTVIEP